MEIKLNNLYYNKAFLVFFSLIFSLIIIISAYLYYHSEEIQIRDQKINELRAVSELKSNEIEKWYKDEMGDAELISRNPALIEYLSLYLNSKSAEHKSKLLSLLETTKMEHSYKEVNLYLPDSSGKLKVFGKNYTLDGPILISLAEEAYREKQLKYSDIYLDPIKEQIRLSFMSPLFIEEKSVAGCLSLSINPNDFLFPLIQSWPTESRTSETLLMKKSGDSVQFISSLRHMKTKSLSFKLPLSRQNLPAVQAVLGRIGVFEGRDYRNIDVFAYLDRIEGTEWFIVTKVDGSEMLAPLMEKAVIVVLFVLLLIIVITGAFSLVYKGRQQKLYRELWESTEEFKTTLFSIGDAVITTNEKGLVKFLNPVAENLTGWNLSEAEGKPLDEVLRIFNAKTRLPVENPVTTVLNTGKIVGLANHTMLISKEGKEYQIADSAAPIVNSDGSIIGVVLVFRDVSREYSMREKLRASEETFRSIVESTPMGIHLYEADDNGSLIFIGANPAADKILGVENKSFIGLSIQEAFPMLADTEIPEKYSRAALYGENWFTEQVNYDHGGITGAFEVYAFRMAPKKAAVLFNEITSRKQAEEKLMKSEAMLSAAINQSSSGVIIADAPNVLIRYANPAAQRIRGSAGIPLTGIELKDISFNWNTYYKDGETPYPAEKLPLSRAIINGETTENEELIIKNENGEPRWVNTNAAPIKDPFGKIISGIVIMQDISARKKSEEDLRESEYKYRNLLETLQEGIWAIDADAYTTLVNRSMADMLDYTIDEMIGKHLFSFMEGQATETAKANLARRRKGIREQHDFELLKKDGQKIYVSMVVSPIIDGSGNYRGAIAGVQDITNRKLIESAVAESESKFRSLFDNITVGAALHEIITDETGNSVDFIWLDANPAYEALTNLRKSDIIGRHAKEILPNLEQKWIDIYGHVALTGKSMKIVDYSEYLSKYLEINAYSPGYKQFAVAMSDITERIKAEEALRQSEERYRKLSEDMPIFISTFLFDGTVIYANKALADSVDYSQESLIGRNFFDFLSANDRETVRRKLSDLTQENPTETHEQEVYTKDRRIVYQQWTNRAFFDGNELKYFQSVGMDITDRKIAELALKQSENKMSSIFRVAPAGIGVVKERIIAEVNPTLCEMTGYSKEELLGRSAAILYPSKEDFEYVGKEKYRQIAEKGTGSVETRWKRKDGTIINLILSSTPIDLNDLSKGVTFTALDITERIKGEAELLAAKEKAEENDKLKTAFLQNLSHEIRTPLNGILGFSELINEIDLKREDIQNYTGIILQSGRRLLNIVNNVLDISKIQTGQINIEKRLFSVNALFFDLYTFFAPQAKSRNIDLSFTIEGDKKLMLNSDEAKLHQIMVNLINNSLKFTKHGFIRFLCYAEGDELLFKVSDSGIGISKDFYERIFDRFVQAEAASNREFEGAGLGLAICKGLLEKMGGRIWVESQPGVETNFFFTLPYEIDIAGFTSAKTGTNAKLKFKGKILIADDDFNSFYYLSRILEYSDIEIFHAENGEEALQIISANPDIELALIDIRMPKMDGIEALNNIRQIKPGLPAIAQTAYAFSEEREKILGLGFNEYISKPIEKARFLELLAKFLSV